MESEIFFRKRNAIEEELRKYIDNEYDMLDHHNGFMHVKYDDFLHAIKRYQKLFSENYPFKAEANDEIKKFLEENIIEKLKAKECKKCKEIAAKIESECMPR